MEAGQSTPKKSSELKQRVIAGLGGLGLILLALFGHPWGYFVLFMLIGVLTQWEFYQLVGLRQKRYLQVYGVLLGVTTNLIVFLHFYQPSVVFSSRYFSLIFPILFVVFLVELYQKNNESPFQDISWWLLGIIYTALPFALLHFIAFDTANGIYSPTNVLGVLFLIWANDIGAYFAGKAFGRTPLFPRISPKKTKEGSVGGVLFTLFVAAGMIFTFNDRDDWKWFVIAGIVIITGTYGDLVESMFKRSIQIKDSGSAIPGHGGFLDRFDAFLLAIPFIVAFLQIF
ncbi:phosphatidate cytidylyltransferase [marine bacterium AO1-C]|nr:phosphatidate cytidylyltransferase [marine bacterium AO1-C]